MFEKGFKFSDPIRDYEIIEYIEKFKMYRLNNLTDSRQDELMEESEIQGYIDNKESIIIKREKNRIFLEKQSAVEQEEKRQQEEEEKEYNNTYCYTDNMTALQKGKILKTLNLKEKYTKYGVLTRKNFIYNAIKDGYVINVAYNVKEWTKNGIKTKDIEYRVHFEEYFNVITKTEYDFAMYLINNNLLRTA